MKAPRSTSTNSSCHHRSIHAFTLIELSVAVAVTAILTAVLLPSLMQSRQRALGISCLNNLNQLTLAVHIYADDNQNAIPPNPPGGGPGGWVLTATGSGVAAAPDATNVALLRNGVLFPYARSYDLYRCPGDLDLVPGVSGVRVRNYSMNGMMGFNAGTIDAHPGIQEHLTLTSVIAPAPAGASIFIDEQSSSSTSSTQTSIDDGFFAIDSGGAGSSTVYSSPIWRNVPASRHGNFGQLSFADGHAGKLNWSVASTRNLKGILANSGVINNPDRKQLWLTTYASGSVSGVPW